MPQGRSAAWSPAGLVGTLASYHGSTMSNVTMYRVPSLTLPKVSLHTSRVRKSRVTTSIAVLPVEGTHIAFPFSRNGNDAWVKAASPSHIESARINGVNTQSGRTYHLNSWTKRW